MSFEQDAAAAFELEGESVNAGDDLALLKRRFGEHLSTAARETLAGCRPYPSLAVIRNPLTRNLLRRVIESDWRSTLAQLDFPHSISDAKFGGVSCQIYRTDATNPAAPTLLYLHAGAFVSGSSAANASAVLPTCHLSGCEAVAVDYSLAPEAVYPTQLEETEAVYRALLADGRSPDRIVIIGDSAGGAIALGSLYRWRRLGLPSPAGIVLLSPILDGAGDSDTHISLKGRDPLFAGVGREGCVESFKLYAGGADITNPEISPLAGDPANLPPALIHVGTREVLLGDSARFAEKARRAGVDASLRVFDGMFHLFHQHWRLAEARAAHQDIADFIGRATGD